MKQIRRSLIVMSAAFAVLFGGGFASDDAATHGLAETAVPPPEERDDNVPVLHRVEPVSHARVLARSESRGEGAPGIDIGTEPVNAERPAARLAPPAVAVETPPVETVQIEDVTVQIEDVTVQIEQVWLDLAECESNQRWAYNGSSGYDGGLQFSPTSWRAVGGTDFAEYAWQATPVEQVVVAERLLEVQGWGAWPACSRKLGLR